MTILYETTYDAKRGSGMTLNQGSDEGAPEPA
jgi:hypothetical protein